MRKVSWTASLPLLACLLAALGCREDAESPTGPESNPVVANVSTHALSFLHVSSGGYHTCGIAADNLAYCWGNNDEGQLGDGTTTDRARPVAVARGIQFTQISAAENHTCAVSTTNRVYCWGLNNFGQLGVKGWFRRLRPILLGGFHFRQVNTGFRHTCAITPSNVAYCWGDNTYGQLGDGTTTDRPTPVRVARELSFRQVKAGSTHTCGVTTGNRAFCWGNDGQGQLGDGNTSTPNDRLSPVPVAGGLSFRHVVAGGGHSCGLGTDNRAYCWGSNARGELGDGTQAGRLTPVAVSGGRSFSLVAAGSVAHTCAVTTGHRGYCWGQNFVGGLGDGTTTDRLTPVAVKGGLLFKGVSPGNHHTCGVTTGGRAYCWGHNGEGQLGAGTETGPETCFGIPCSTKPVAVVGPT